MQLLVELIPFLVMLGMYAGFAKLSARVLGIQGIGWNHTLLLAAIVGAITLLLSLLPSGRSPTVISLPLSIVGHLVLFGWFFRGRGITRSGDAIGWLGGIKIGALTLGMSVVLSIALLLILNALPRQSVLSEFPSWRGYPADDGLGGGNFRAKLEFLGVEYTIVEDPRTGDPWIVWSQADAEFVESIRSTYYDADDISSQLRLLEEIGDLDRYAELLRNEADAGNGEAQVLLGIDFLTGRYTARDYQAALQWFMSASERGHDTSMFVGNMYENGLGVEQNYEEALRYFRRAAGNGEAMALCEIGFYYRQGFGVERDTEIAEQYFSDAALAGADCDLPGISP